MPSRYARGYDFWEGQDIELMPQDQDFGFQLPSRLEAVAQHTAEQETKGNHAAIMF
jgi:hypothetical protein